MSEDKEDKAVTNSTTNSAPIGKCALCDTENVELRESHAIPKFTYQWLKGTSKTPYIRGSDDVNSRLQDGPKEYLLCGACEGTLSVMENEIAQKLFRKIANYRKQAKKITITETMRTGILSIFWRALLTTKHRDNTRTNEDNTVLESLLSSMKSQITDKICVTDIYFAPFHGTPPYYGFPLDTTYQLERSIGGQDIRFFDNPHRFFATFKFPFMYFYIFSKGWDEDEMKKSTVLNAGDLALDEIKEIPNVLATYIRHMKDQFERTRLLMSPYNMEKIIADAGRNKEVTGSDKSLARMLGKNASEDL